MFFQLENNPTASFPAAFLVTYQDVRNVINLQMNKLSRKHVDDQTSSRLWLEAFASNDDYTLFEVLPGGPFLVSWITKWQMKVRISIA